MTGLASRGAGVPGSRVVVRSMVRSEFSRPPARLVDIVAQATVPRLSELVGRMYTMDPGIRAMGNPAITVTGVATTAKCPPGDNMGLVKALTLVKPGDLLVVDAQGFETWCLGGYQLLRYAKDHHGLAGVIVNGAYRDGDEAQAAGFPLYARCLAPYSGPKSGPCEVNVPVCCGGVIVQPGDVVSASSEGIVVVPQRALEAVAAALALDAKAGHDTDELLQSLFARAKDLDCDEIVGAGDSGRNTLGPNHGI